MSKAITEKKYYRVGETFSYTDKDYIGLLDIPFGIWVTTHSFEVISSMKWEKAYKLCTQITGKIIDESVKNCCIFVYLDGANYDKEEYRQVTWDELMKECTPVEVIVYEQRKIDIMITIEKAYEKFYKLLEQIDNSNIPSSEQYELYQDMKSEIEQKKQQAYADMYEY